jgi:hypothetical protein
LRRDLPFGWMLSRVMHFQISGIGPDAQVPCGFSSSSFRCITSPRSEHFVMNQCRTSWSSRTCFYEDGCSFPVRGQCPLICNW